MSDEQLMRRERLGSYVCQKGLQMRKNPILAAILGVLFGAFGIGIYFRSFKDFLLCLGLQILLILLPIPPLNFALSWAAAATYGLIRANQD